MATLTSTRKAPILDENGVQLTTDVANVSSSSVGVVAIQWAGGPVFAVGGNVGEATLTATRIGSGVTATLVVQVTPAPFAISLGAEVPA